MKKNLTTIALALSIAVSAQTTFSLQHHEALTAVTAGSSIYAAVAAEETHKANFDITNTSGSAQTYKIRRYDIALNKQGSDEAIAFFCFGGGCYTPGVTNSMDAVTLQPGEKTSSLAGDFQMLLAELTELSTTGFSHVKYTVYNTSDANDTLQFSILYNDPSAGLNNITGTKADFRLAPNPASGSAAVHVNMSLSATCDISIYNALGALVHSSNQQLNAGNNTLPIEISGLKKGLYFVSLQVGNEKAVRRLIVN